MPDTTGNGLLYASLYYIQLVLNGEARAADFTEFESIIKRCMTQDGFLNRSQSKGSNEQTGRDDYVGVCAAARIMGSRIAWRLVDAGNRKWFFGLLKWKYKNHEPQNNSLLSLDTWKAWFGRMPWDIAAMQWAADIEPHFIRRAFLAASIAWSSTKPSTTLQTWMRYACSKERCWMVESAWEVFRTRVQSAGGFEKILSGELERDHPILRYWRDL